MDFNSSDGGSLVSSSCSSSCPLFSKVTGNDHEMSSSKLMSNAASSTVMATDNSVIHSAGPLPDNHVPTTLHTTPRMPQSPHKSKWSGFKMEMDNVDKNEKSRYSRIENKRPTSHHYVNMYGVKDRIDFSALSDEQPSPLSNVIESLASLLPSSADDHHIRHNFIIHISRVLAKHLTYFKVCFEDIVTKHIKHDYYDQMEQKSHVVSEYSIKLLLILNFVLHYRFP